jgi:hypothetical protein
MSKNNKLEVNLKYNCCITAREQYGIFLVEVSNQEPYWTRYTCEILRPSTEWFLGIIHMLLSPHVRELKI